MLERMIQIIAMTGIRMARAARIASALVIAGSLLPTASGAQTNVNHIAVHAGIVRIFDPWIMQHAFPYVFYPEVQIGGDLGRPGFGWEVFWGYTDDGPKATEVPMSGAYSSHAAGVRFAVRPQFLLPHWAIPLGVFVGGAFHSVTYRRFGRWSGPSIVYSQLPSSDPEDQWILGLEAGLFLEFHLIGPLGMQFEGRQMIPLDEGFPDGALAYRRSFTTGLTWAW